MAAQRIRDASAAAQQPPLMSVSRPGGLHGHLRVRADEEVLKDFPNWRIELTLTVDKKVEGTVLREDFGRSTGFVAVKNYVLQGDAPPLHVSAGNDNDGTEEFDIDVKPVLHGKEQVVVAQMPSSGLTIWVEFFGTDEMLVV